MSYSVEFTEAARSDIKKLTSKVQAHVLKKIRWLAENFESRRWPVNDEVSRQEVFLICPGRLLVLIEHEVKQRRPALEP